MLRILIVGLDRSGKTTLLEQAKSLFASSRNKEKNETTTRSKLSQISSTIGLNVGKVRHSKGSDLLFWDLGGEESMREIWEHYFEDADAVIFVIDAADAKRFREAGRELKQIAADRRLRGVPILVVANKQDSSNARDPGQIMKKGFAWKDEEKEAFRKGRVVSVQGVSALTCEGLGEGIDWIVDACSSSSVAKSSFSSSSKSTSTLKTP